MKNIKWISPFCFLSLLISAGFAEVSTASIDLTGTSKWKCVMLKFSVQDIPADVRLTILKHAAGEVFVDDVGIIPYPLAN